MKQDSNGFGNSMNARVIQSTEDLGALIKYVRESDKMTQLDLAGLANTGNRFIVDLEKGKPTIQLGLVLKIIDLMGLEVTIKRKSA